MPRPRLLNVDEATLRDLYINKRLTAPRIAEQMGFTTGTIRIRLAEFGITRDKPINLLELPSEELKRLYVDQRMPMNDIAKHFSCSRGAVRDRIIATGIHKQKSQIQKKSQRFHLTKEQLTELYIEKNQSDEKIARDHGVCNITVANWRKKWGIKREHPPNYIPLQPEQLREMYVEKRMTLQQIGDYFGCSDHTVRAHVVKLGLSLDNAELAARRLERNAIKYKREFTSGGYRRLLHREHPAANRHGYVAEHRYVAEAAIGRYLQQDEHVHHINLDKMDNRVENLAVLPSKQAHALVHRYLERVAVFMLGFSCKPPAPMVFASPAFWGGKWVTEIDLLEHVRKVALPSDSNQ